VSGVVVSALFVSDRVRLRCLLLFRREGRPRSIMDDSDMFLLCEALWDAICAAIGSLLSTLGDPRLDAGDAARKGLVNTVGGVGSGRIVFGERRISTALKGVFPPEVIEAGVKSCVLLAFEFSMRGVGEPLRSTAGDFGGTCGGNSRSPGKLAVSTLSVGFGLAIGLTMGDKGFPEALGVSREVAGVFCSDWVAEGPVTHETIASPKGPALQFVPGALHDLSWPKASCDS
jgi:hypothetical protein